MKKQAIRLALGISLLIVIIMMAPHFSVTANDGYVARNSIHEKSVSPSASTWTVTGTLDPGDGTCDDTCSLRDAISAATSGDTIDFSVSGTITLGSALPQINKMITIDGAGQTITVSGNDSYRVFDVAAGGDLTVNNMTVANGNSNASGGGIYVTSGGMLAVTNSTFSGNETSSTGGGIYNEGTITAIANSTIFDNSASLFGGGIYNDGAITTVANSTFSGNSALFLGGGISNEGTITTIANSIVADNTGGNCDGVPLGTNNLTDSAGCSTWPTTLNPAIHLGPLADNGGPTETMALAPPSPANPAIDSGDAATCADAGTVNNLDQRGETRPQGTGCDVGAYELFYCAAGNYDNGSASCTLAPEGYFVPAPGATSATPCPPGYFQDQPGQTSCLAADPGYYVPASAAIEQIECPTGTTSNAAAVACTIQSGPNFVVNSTADSDDTSCSLLGQGSGNQDCTLREAINATNALAGTDTITFSVSGTITLGSLLSAIDDVLTIDGAGQTITISGDDQYLVFDVAAGGDLTINHLTIADGRGGIYNDGTLAVTDSTFSDNFSTGGGIYNAGGTITTIANSTFSGNDGGAIVGGGGIYNYYGTITTITNSTFSGNYADDAAGGGIFNDGTIMTIANSTFSGNYYIRVVAGGGIYNDGDITTITNSTFSSNYAEIDGGGIYNADGGRITTITNSTFSGNDAGGDGGGIYFQDSLSSPKTTIANSTFSDNSANSDGGGIFNAYQNIAITNSTFSGNSARNKGGGIYNEGIIDVVIANSTFSDNSAQFDGGIYNSQVLEEIANSTFSGNEADSLGGGIYNDGTITTIVNSIVADNIGGNCDGVPLGTNNLTDSTGCSTWPTTLNPAIHLGPLVDNGGPTETMALLPTSPTNPAIDSGDAATCADAGTVNNLDQRGVTRPQGTGCDIGAFEAWWLTISVASASDASLAWVAANTGCTFDVFESTTPYFTPTAPATYALVTSPHPLPGKLGTVGSNYFYINRRTCGTTTTDSNEVAEFDFALVPGS